MSDRYPDLPEGAPWSVTRVYYPANAYEHPPTGLLLLRLVRRGSSYADIDLGLGLRRVFTRPGDLLCSLPDRPTAFRIDEGRELTLLQVQPRLAETLLRSAGGRALEELRPLSHGPTREPIVAELMRRLESDEISAAAARDWALGLILTAMLNAARRLTQASRGRVLSYPKLKELLGRVEENLVGPWSVQSLAEAAGMPRRSFAAAFKEAKGLPFHQYLVRLRAERAAALLRETSLPIAEIATRTGFAHQAHLSRATSKLLGASPMQIRETGAAQHRLREEASKPNPFRKSGSRG